MFIKRILIYFPLVLILFLAQSFFWVPVKYAVDKVLRLRAHLLLVRFVVAQIHVYDVLVYFILAFLLALGVEGRVTCQQLVR